KAAACSTATPATGWRAVPPSSSTPTEPSSCSPSLTWGIRPRRLSPPSPDRVGAGTSHGSGQYLSTEHGAGGVGQGPLGIHGRPAKPAEGLVLGQPLLGHEQALGPLDHFSIGQGL